MTASTGTASPVTGSPVTASTGTSTDIDVTRAVFGAFARGDLAALGDLLHADATWHHHNDDRFGGIHRGADAIIAYLTESAPRWMPPRRSSLRWCQVASAYSRSLSAARSPLANVPKTARTTSASVMVAVLAVPVLAVMDGS